MQPPTFPSMLDFINIVHTYLPALVTLLLKLSTNKPSYSYSQSDDQRYEAMFSYTPA